MEEGWDPATLTGVKVLKYKRVGHKNGDMVVKIDGYGNKLFVADATSLTPESNLQDFEFIWQNKHVNLLPCCFSVGKSHIIYEDYQETFLQYLQRYERSGYGVIMDDISIPNSLGRNARKKDAFYVPEVLRNIFQCIYRFLRFIHKKKHCTAGFDISNLVMTDGSIQFFKLQVRRVGESRISESIASDFKSLARLVESIFHDHRSRFPRKEIPIEMTKWIEHLDDFNSMNERFMDNHFALLNSSSRISFLQTIHTNQSLILSQARNAALSYMGDNEGWKSKITRFWGPAFECLNWERLDFPYEDTNQDIVGDQRANSHLLRFIRNFAVHYKDNVQSFRAPSQHIHVDAVVMKMYGLEILQFLEGASREKVGLNSHNCFNRLAFRL